MRGGKEYLTLIRKMEPIAIRVVLEDGDKDLDIYAGDWWIATQSMQRALAFAGYEVLVRCGEKAFIRRVKAVGAPAYLPPVAPPKPAL